MLLCKYSRVIICFEKPVSVIEVIIVNVRKGFSGFVPKLVSSFWRG
jgi:hypothetical protein